MAKVIEIGSIDTTQYANTVDDQTINGVKTFTQSPIVPTPTTNTQVANKQYVDNSQIRPVYTNAQNNVGCYYSTAVLTTLNVVDYLSVGEYGLGISSDCTGKPAAITAATRILLKTISTYPTPNATYSPYIRQDLYAPSLDRHWYRIVNYAASNNITYGEWQEIDLAFEVVS